MNAKIPAIVVSVMLLCSTCFAQQQGVGAKDSSASEPQLVQSLLGSWVIDLRPAPDEPAYLKDFVVKTYEAATLKGSFYDTDFDNGRIHTAWGKLYFAFTTADGSGIYYHSGYVEKGKLFGTSFSPSRQFMLPWTGVRKQ